MLLDYRARVQFLPFPVVKQFWLFGVLNAFRCFGSAIALKTILSKKGLIGNGLLHWSEIQHFALWFQKCWLVFFFFP